MSLSLIIVYAFEFAFCVLSPLSILLNSKNIAVTNLKPFESDIKSVNLLLIADSSSLICSSGSKEFKISTL